MPTKINGPTEARYSMSFEASFSTVWHWQKGHCKAELKDSHPFWNDNSHEQ